MTPAAARAGRPLEHLKVVDLTRLLPGGYCTLLLADLGADVLKVEEPGKGDYVRWMPPMAGDISAGHLALNRGKRSLTLNLKHDAGRDVLKRLARDADVLIESFRPGVMDRLGVGYDALAAENPRLVYCAISGYGQDGPYRDRAGHDINYLGYAGVLDIVGESPDHPPVDPGVQIADIGGGGLMAAVGILAALSERERTGRGRFVDIGMMDGALSWLSIHVQAYTMTGVVPKRGAMRLSGELACYHVYRAGDGKYVTVGALEPQFWRAFCEALGLGELIEQQFASHEQQEAMKATIAEKLATRSRDEWCAELAHLDMCFGPVNDMEEALADPQAIARAMVADVPVPGGSVRAVGNPLKMRGDDALPLRAAPGFGEHTEDVLRASGYGDDDIKSMREAGTI
jgi:crotonobetainyl-CoA:carnitine CoA-transferase CaiB-like acyl-CoA transferase